MIDMANVTEQIRRFAKSIVNFDEDERAQQIAEYIAAETERCAKIADEQDDECPSWAAHTYDNGGTQDGWHMACSAVAKAIRGQT